MKPLYPDNPNIANYDTYSGTIDGWDVYICEVGTQAPPYVCICNGNDSASFVVEPVILDRYSPHLMDFCKALINLAQ